MFIVHLVMTGLVSIIMVDWFTDAVGLVQVVYDGVTHDWLKECFTQVCS